jgi:hypothetical protein
MIENSLRRPRFLIDLCERTLSFAVNRGHGFVTEADVEEGLRQMSLYLVSDFGYEMRDVVGTPEDIFYSFIGAPNLLTGQDLEKLLSEDVFGLDAKEIIDLLLWYGFLGVVGPSTEPIFIYDRAYDFRRLEAERADTKDKAPTPKSRLLFGPFAVPANSLAARSSGCYLQKAVLIDPI